MHEVGLQASERFGFLKKPKQMSGWLGYRFSNNVYFTRKEMFSLPTDQIGSSSVHEFWQRWQ